MKNKTKKNLHLVRMMDAAKPVTGPAILQLTTLQILMYSVQISACNVLSTVYNVQCTDFIVYCTVYSVQCTVYRFHRVLYCLQCTVYVYRFERVLYCLQCTVYSVHISTCIVQFTVYSVQCTDFNVYCTGCPKKHGNSVTNSISSF